MSFIVTRARSMRCHLVTICSVKHLHLPLWMLLEKSGKGVSLNIPVKNLLYG